jgi:hypothetical protein
MRSSLEQMERVAAYLSGTLSPEQTATFEAEMAGDPVLREQVEFQQDVARIAQRRAYRSEISAAAKYVGYSGLSWKLVSMITGTVAVAGVAGYLIYSKLSEPVKTVQAAPQSELPLGSNPEQTDTTTAPVTVEEEQVLQNLNLFMASRDYRDLPVFMTTVLAESTGQTIETAKETDPKREQFLAVDSFDQLDFTPRGFYDELRKTLSVKRPVELSQKDVYDYYYRLGGKSWKREERQDSIVIDKWNKKELNGLSTSGGKRRKKNMAYGYIVDGKGDKMKNVAVEYLFYGDKRTTKTDENGMFSFKLYGRIKTDVTLTIPDAGKVSLTDIEFEPRKEIGLQVKLPDGNGRDIQGSVIHYGVRSAEVIPDGCFVSPASVKAIREWVFGTTFLATKQFEARLKVLHQLENGQELLEIYVNNVTKELWVVDQLVADRLTGREKAIFEAFSAEKLGNTSYASGDHPASQEDYTSKYNYYKTMYQQEIDRAAAYQTEEQQQVSIHMLEFIAACRK